MLTVVSRLSIVERARSGGGGSCGLVVCKAHSVVLFKTPPQISENNTWTPHPIAQLPPSAPYTLPRRCLKSANMLT